MPDRRQFLKQAAGIAMAASRAFSARREVAVGGRRVRTIDVHAHTAIPDALKLMGLPSNNASLIDTEERLKHMDEQGIDMEALSINANWYKLDRSLAREVIQAQNEGLARICARRPDRFVALATVALQYPDMAAEQLEEGVRKLGLRGGGVAPTVNSEELSAPKFDPFWAKAEELGVMIFMHPNGMPELQSRLKGNGMLTNVIGNPLETTIALAHLIFDGVLDRFPGLKLCAAHGGGFLPSYAGRFDHGCLTFPQNCEKGNPRKPASEYLRRLYFDALVFTPEALRHLIAECGVSQLMIGTDYPYPWTATAVDHVLATPGLSDAERTAILGGNAAKLLRIA